MNPTPEQYAALKAERDALKDALHIEIDKLSARMTEALAELKSTTSDYDVELDSCDTWIAWCKEHGNDMYGVNFHQGRMSGIIAGNIIHSKTINELTQSLAQARAEASELRARLIRIIELHDTDGRALLVALKERDEARAEVERLKAWKESALSVWPPMQEIGNAIGLTLGQSIYDKILPAIQTLKSDLERSRAEVDYHCKTVSLYKERIDELLRYELDLDSARKEIHELKLAADFTSKVNEKAQQVIDEYGNTMGRIAIALFGDKNNRTDEECIAQAERSRAECREAAEALKRLHDDDKLTCDNITYNIADGNCPCSGCQSAAFLNRVKETP